MPRQLTTVAAPAPSALTTLISQASATSDPVSALTTQVFHNLQHQHLWTSLEIHYPQNEQTTVVSQPYEQRQDVASSVSLNPALALPLISGIPPHRMYTHPDEQLYLLEIGLREEDLPAERMFVLPSTQTQSWTLGQLAAVFDTLPPPSNSSRERHNNKPEEDTRDESGSQEKQRKIAQYFERRRKANERSEWGGKRLLFAVVDRLVGGDGTMVYYVVHDGYVKPRQN